MKLSDLLVPSTKFSKFRCDTYKKFSAQAGILYPVWFNLLNPGESASIDLRTVIRSWPVESPLMGSVKVRFVTAAFNLKNYAMALEGYKRNFDWRSVVLPNWSFYFNSSDTLSSYYKERLVSELEAGSIGRDDLASTRIIVNYAHYLGVSDCSLADYLGYPSGWLPSVTTNLSSTSADSGSVRFVKSFLSFLCYYDFYRNYLINPQESYFPIFMSAPTVKEFSIGDVKRNCLTNESVLGMLPVSSLDDWISSIHKKYDGTAQGAINEDANISTFLRWSSLPSQFDTESLFTERGNTFSSIHGGLVSTLYDSDINTQWMSVDNYSKLNEVRINTQTESGATFSSFADIVKASSLWDFVTRSVNSDGTYGDFIGNQFGVTVKGDMNIPQIVHVYDTLLTFDDITSQSDTVTNPDSGIGAVVGQQFGVGRSFGQSNRFNVVNSDGNYVMLMTFMWMTPQVCYSNGLNHLNNIVSFSDFYQPSFDNYAMEGRIQEYVNAAVPSYDDVDSRYFDYDVYQNNNNPMYKPLIERGALYSNSVLGYQPAWSNYKTDVDVVHGLFRSKLDFYTITRRVPFITNSLILTPNSNSSAYVWYNPSLTPSSASSHMTFQLPFAVETEDPFQVQLRVGCTIKRAMSKNVNPNIK